jgi:hypothetical protein
MSMFVVNVCHMRMVMLEASVLDILYNTGVHVTFKPKRGPGKGKMATSLRRAPRVRIQGSAQAIRIGRHGQALTPYRIAMFHMWMCMILHFLSGTNVFIFLSW